MSQFILDLQSICRDCGAICLPQAWEERDGLCARCAHKPCDPYNTVATTASGLRAGDVVEFVPVKVRPSERVLFMNGKMIVGAGAIADALNLAATERDPIRRAIDREFGRLIASLGADA